MDPLTQASIGAAAAAVFSRRGSIRVALLVGAVAGAAPDLDVFLRSDADPLLALHYHRHFTHALVMAPVIGLLVAGLCKVLFFRKWSFGQLAAFAIAGAMTHGLLDACTSYGTSLYWPFDDRRESWDVISIIDPLFTLPLIGLILTGWVRKQPGLARWAVLYCLAYLSLGLFQRERSEAFARELAASRDHVPTEVTVRPSLANTLLWRIVYQEGDEYHVDAVWIFPGRPPRLYAGSTVAAFTEAKARELVGPETVLGRDIERFRHFSQGYLYLNPEMPSVVGDLRYAMMPDSVHPLWGIRLYPEDPDRHVSLVTFRDPRRETFNRLWRMITGQPVENLD